MDPLNIIRVSLFHKTAANCILSDSWANFCLMKLCFSNVSYFYLISIFCFPLNWLGFDWTRIKNILLDKRPSKCRKPYKLNFRFWNCCNRPSHLDWIGSSCKFFFSRIKTNTQESKPDAKIRTRRDVKKELRCWKFKWEVNIKMQTVESRNFDKFGLISTVSMSAGQIGATVIFEVSTFYHLGSPLVLLH